MKSSDLYKTLRTDLSLADRAGFNPYYRKMLRDMQGKLTVDGKVFFDLASNDYLGLATNPRVTTAMLEATAAFGASFCGTPIAAGYAQVIAELEDAAAAMVGLESAVVFPSCYQANTSLFPSIANSNDTIIVDHDAHASLVGGIKASGARIRPFLHNNVNHLEKQLAASQDQRRLFVVTESVFSTQGSIAPLDIMVNLCNRYGATPIIDDSHGIGVLGKNGRGILEYKDIHDFDGIYTASLGKALANAGGIVAGKKEFIEYVRYNCPGLMYSTALVPASAAGALAAIAAVNVGKIELGIAFSQQVDSAAKKTIFFGCCANIGLGASLARAANGGIRRYLGDTAGTFLSLLGVAMRYRAATVSVTIDGHVRTVKRISDIAVGKTRHIASGIKVYHELSKIDKRLYVVTVANLSLFNIVAALRRFYSGKPIPSGCTYLSLGYGSRIEISCSTPLEIECDGDSAGFCPCVISTAPDSLDLITEVP